MTAPPPTPVVLPEELRLTALFIRDTQLANGAIPWFRGGKLDPWDHTEAAMALSVAGLREEAARAYHWLAQNQLPDGSWYANYFSGAQGDLSSEKNPASLEHDPEPLEHNHSSLRETNFVAYVASGVWHHFLITRDGEFLADLFPCVQNAVEFVLRYQSQYGEIAWAVDENGNAQDDALVTACCSILRSLDCACRIAHALGKSESRWRDAADRLELALLEHPERFDRTWESKARFSMDWYYPILAGIYRGEDARRRIEQRWHEFVEPGLGCRCVNDEPWVTMAETSELVIALMASGEHEKALALYDTLHQWRDRDGGYWTGYVFRDRAIWPEEKTTWTAGAVLLAADALLGLSPAHRLFLTPREQGANLS